ncbi:hypothetical protein LEAN103870_02510 [Legionella anisa]|uniref:Uncharacterized protein n=1 Tax=Legionella anisa TaxID=28082 RepID=A0AAX0WY20_9GAMM|nr:hypothetical protein [Legionella anisa]AWN74315.1 hypothetical protein DLD14_10915 [Legionella anisa]KTC72007.1 hypothetical protein Lani_1599 [Legionella anisa]MCW8425649.1 hypothetical protein [Legionella anisa]MCW8448922.1 hypothetical protein [Legionella anisa]PNL61789.1 hypothetical protein A6J39_011535 [Legionella anisa]
MTAQKLWSLFVSICFFIYSYLGYAKSNSIQFFYSNNNQILDIEKAYQRLTGKEQHELKKNAIRILQQQHMELGQFKNALGTYIMQETHQFTAENAEVFFVSPLQKLSFPKTVFIASILAKQLDQESVAVFIPTNTNTIAHIKLIFNGNNPPITEVIQLVHKLPASFTKAFTLNLKNIHSAFDSAEVHSIEWLGSNLNSSVIKNTFPFDKVLSDNGEAYLVFNTGKYQKL